MVVRAPILRLAVLCLFLLPASVCAQQPAGAIAGMVIDPTGARIPRARVNIDSPVTGFTLEITTSAAGVYTASGLVPGSYGVRVAAPGFCSSVTATEVEVGRTSTVDVQLQVGAASDSISVSTEAVRVDTSQATLQGVVTGNLIRDLPLNGRNFLELGQLEPGVQINTNGTLVGVAGHNTAIGLDGQSGLQTAVTLDGLNISDDHFGAVLANVSQDAIQEFQVTRSAQDISTGLSGNGAVNIVTRSGTNQLHGNALLYWRDDTLAASLADTPVPFDREHFGFTAGGPFRRDRLFWFASYEGIKQNTGVVTVVPLFPQYSGTWRVPYDEHMALGRVDWTIGSGTRAFARFLHDDRRGIEVGPSFGETNLVPVSKQDFSNQTGAGLDIIRGRFTHSFRFGYLNSNLRDQSGNALIPGMPQTLDPGGRPMTVVIGTALTLGTNGNTPSNRFIDSYETRYDGGVTFGRHTVRWGVLTDVIRSNWYDTLFAVPNVKLQFNADLLSRCTPAAQTPDPLCFPIADVTAGNGLGWMSDLPSLGFPYGGFKNNRIHAYIGDSWRATSRLQVNLGLRWVYEPGPNTPDIVKPAILEEFAPGLSNSVSQDTNNFAPQIGVALDPTGSGKWVVRASAGVFYDNFLLRNNWWIRNNLTRAPIATANTSLVKGLVDPNTGQMIFRLDGSDPTALIGAGVNWLSGPQCTHYPTLPPGTCALGEPGLLDDALNASALWRQAYALRADEGVSQKSNCEFLRNCQLMDPNYHTPYVLQFSVGMQRELRSGLVLSVDYVRHRGLRFPMRTEVNRVGAADTLDPEKATAAIVATNKAFGCGASASPAAIDCAISQGATIWNYADKGLGSKGSHTAKDGAESSIAFGGLNPQFNNFVEYLSRGWFTYNALQVNLRGNLPDVRSGLHNWTIVSSYSFSRLVGSEQEPSLIWLQADDFKYMTGTMSLDRTHIFSLATGFDSFLGLRLSSFWRVLSPMSQSVFLQPTRTGNGATAEIFLTDLNGDGSSGDPLPGTNRGSYGRDIGCGGAALNRVIDSYNSTQAGQLTPAGQALVNAGLFSSPQLKSLGAVSPAVPRAPADQVCMDWLATTDLRISRPFKLHNERVTIEPALELFNVFNFANYDLPASILDGVLTGLPGSINGTTPANRTNRAGVTGGTMSLGAPRSWQLSVRVTF